MAASRRLKKLLPGAALTVVGLTCSGQSAYALFPPIWPTAAPPAVISPPPVTPPVVVVPPVTPPPFVSPPPVTPPVVVVPPTCPPTNCNCVTPEPSSLIAGVTGLVTAAGWAARRRRKGA